MIVDNNNYHFSVYKHSYVVNDEKLLTRNFIVLKDGYLIVRFTNFHLYIGHLGRSIKRLESNDGTRFFYICKFLNYVFFQQYHVTKLTDVTSEMVIRFCKEYGSCTLPDDTPSTHRSKSTINACLKDVLGFVCVLSESFPTMKLKESDFYTEKLKLNMRTKRMEKIKDLSFEMRYNSKGEPIFRDITDEAFTILMNVIIDQHTNILMLAALGAFAGLRPSEACNVRRKEYGGLSFQLIGDEVTNISIDLNEEKNMRSDFVRVGGIKKERTQNVYPAFLKVFCELYKIYMDYIEGRPYETKFGALTTNRDGMAMTYPSYVYEFHKAVNDSIPIMLKSGNPKTQLYGQLLQTRSLSPHIFRHWFSMKLVLYGEDLPALMKYRGDKSPESSLTYLANKSELVKQLDHVQDRIFDFELWRASKEYGRSEQ